MDNKIKNIITGVEAGYDLVAEKFSSTRNFFWKDLSFLADLVKNGDKILDFGCGNGRLLEILKGKEIEYFGVDVSQKLIDLAKEKYPKQKNNFSKIEAQESLAFPSDFFNAIFSIAVFHHFPENYQKERIAKLYRSLKPGGKLALTVWNLQDKYDEKEVKISFEDNEGKVFERYHYVFNEKELQDLLLEAGFKVERCDIINGKNILIIAEK